MAGDGGVLVVGQCMKILTSTFGLFLINLTYLFLGAWLFLAIEAPREESLHNNLEGERDSLVDSIIALGQGQEEYYKGNASEKLASYEVSLANFYRKRATFKLASGNESVADLKLWTPAGAIIYCYSVITTIGWGNIVPATVNGRLGTVIYGLNGMPLLFTLSSEVGASCSKMIFSAWGFVQRLIKPYTKDKKPTSAKSKAKKKKAAEEDDDDDESDDDDDDDNENKNTHYRKRHSWSKTLLLSESETEGSDSTGIDNAQDPIYLMSKRDRLKYQRLVASGYKLSNITKSSKYLNSTRSCIDYLLHASIEARKGKTAPEFPHYRIRNCQDALLLCNQFSCMSSEEMIKCMEYVSFDYAKEVLCRTGHKDLGHNDMKATVTFDVQDVTPLSQEDVGHATKSDVVSSSTQIRQHYPYPQRFEIMKEYPIEHQVHVSRATAPLEHQAHVLRAMVPLEHSAHVSRATVSLEDQAHVHRATVPLEYQTHVSRSMVPLEHSAYIHRAMVPLEDQAHVRRAMVPLEHSAHVSRATAPLEHQAHVHRAMVPLEHSAHVSRATVPLEHQAHVSRATVPIEDQAHVPRATVPLEHQTHVSRATVPIEDQAHVPRATVPLEHQAHIPRATVPLEHQAHVSRATVPIEHQAHVPRATVPIEHQAHVSRATVPIEHQAHVSRATVPIEHQAHVSRATVPIEHQAHVSRATVPLEHQAHVYRAMVPLEHQTHVPRAMSPLEHQTHVPRATVPLEHQAHVSRATVPLEHQAHVYRAMVPLEHQAHVPRAMSPLEHQANVPRAMVPLEHQANVPRAMVSLEHQTHVARATVPIEHQIHVPRAAVPLEHQAHVYRATVPIEHQIHVPRAAVPLKHQAQVFTSKDTTVPSTRSTSSNMPCHHEIQIFCPNNTAGNNKIIQAHMRPLQHHVHMCRYVEQNESSTQNTRTDDVIDMRAPQGVYLFRCTGQAEQRHDSSTVPTLTGRNNEMINSTNAEGHIKHIPHQHGQKMYALMLPASQRIEEHLIPLPRPERPRTELDHKYEPTWLLENATSVSPSTTCAGITALSTNVKNIVRRPTQTERNTQDRLYSNVADIPPTQDRLYSNVADIPPTQDRLYSNVADIPPTQDRLYSNVADIPPTQDRLYSNVADIPPTQDILYSNVADIPPTDLRDHAQSTFSGDCLVTGHNPINSNISTTDNRPGNGCLTKFTPILSFSRCAMDNGPISTNKFSTTSSDMLTQTDPCPTDNKSQEHRATCKLVQTNVHPNGCLKDSTERKNFLNSESHHDSSALVIKKWSEIGLDSVNVSLPGNNEPIPESALGQNKTQELVNQYTILESEHKHISVTRPTSNFMTQSKLIQKKNLLEGRHVAASEEFQTREEQSDDNNQIKQRTCELCYMDENTNIISEQTETSITSQWTHSDIVSQISDTLRLGMRKRTGYKSVVNDSPKLYPTNTFSIHSSANTKNTVEDVRENRKSYNQTFAGSNLKTMIDFVPQDIDKDNAQGDQRNIVFSGSQLCSGTTTALEVAQTGQKLKCLTTNGNLISLSEVCNRDPPTSFDLAENNVQIQKNNASASVNKVSCTSVHALARTLRQETAHTSGHDLAHTLRQDTAHTSGHDLTHTSRQDMAYTSVHDLARTSVSDLTHTSVQDMTHTSVQDFSHKSGHNVVDTSGYCLTRQSENYLTSTSGHPISHKFVHKMTPTHVQVTAYTHDPGDPLSNTFHKSEELKYHSDMDHIRGISQDQTRSESDQYSSKKASTITHLGKQSIMHVPSCRQLIRISHHEPGRFLLRENDSSAHSSKTRSITEVNQRINTLASSLDHALQLEEVDTHKQRLKSDSISQASSPRIISKSNKDQICAVMHKAFRTINMLGSGETSQGSGISSKFRQSSNFTQPSLEAIDQFLSVNDGFTVRDKSGTFCVTDARDTSVRQVCCGKCGPTGSVTKQAISCQGCINGNHSSQFFCKNVSCGVVRQSGTTFVGIKEENTDIPLKAWGQHNHMVHGNVDRCPSYSEFPPAELRGKSQERLFNFKPLSDTTLQKIPNSQTIRERRKTNQLLDTTLHEIPNIQTIKERSNTKKWLDNTLKEVPKSQKMKESLDINMNYDEEEDEDEMCTIYSSGRLLDFDDDNNDDDDDEEEEFVSGRGLSFNLRRAKQFAAITKKTPLLRHDYSAFSGFAGLGFSRQEDKKPAVPVLEKFHMPLFFLYSLNILYVFMGSIVFYTWETKVEFWDSLYFIYVLLSTTGFGDILPKPSFYTFIVIYATIGMPIYNIMVNATLELFLEVLEYLASLGEASKKEGYLVQKK